MTIVFLPLPAATKQIKLGLVHRCSPAQMSKHIQPLPVLQRPTAVDNAGDGGGLRQAVGAGNTSLGWRSSHGDECFSNCKIGLAADSNIRHANELDGFDGL